MGIKNIVNEFENGQIIIVNGNDGVVIINPDKETLNKYRKSIK